MGILAHGIYPSSVCRRLNGLMPVMTVKARVTAIQPVLPGDTVGYGMRWQASVRAHCHPAHRLRGWIPRVRNEGRPARGSEGSPLAGASPWTP